MSQHDHQPEQYPDVWGEMLEWIKGLVLACGLILAAFVVAALACVIFLRWGA